MLAPYKAGGCPVSIHYSNGAAECRIDLGDGWRVKPEEELLDALNEWLAPENVELVY